MIPAAALMGNQHMIWPTERASSLLQSALNSQKKKSWYGENGPDRRLQSQCSIKEQLPAITQACYDQDDVTICPDFCGTGADVTFSCQMQDETSFQYTCEYTDGTACPGACYTDAICDNCFALGIDLDVFAAQQSPALENCVRNHDDYNNYNERERPTCTSCEKRGDAYEFTCEFPCYRCSGIQCVVDHTKDSFAMDSTNWVATTYYETYEVVQGSDKGTVMDLMQTFNRVDGLSCHLSINGKECQSCTFVLCDDNYEIMADCGNLSTESFYNGCTRTATGLFISLIVDEDDPEVVCTSSTVNDDTTANADPSDGAHTTTNSDNVVDEKPTYSEITKNDVGNTSLAADHQRFYYWFLAGVLVVVLML